MQHCVCGRRCNTVYVVGDATLCMWQAMQHCVCKCQATQHCVCKCQATQHCVRGRQRNTVRGRQRNTVRSRQRNTVRSRQRNTVYVAGNATLYLAGNATLYVAGNATLYVAGNATLCMWQATQWYRAHCAPMPECLPPHYIDYCSQIHHCGSDRLHGSSEGSGCSVRARFWRALRSSSHKTQSTVKCSAMSSITRYNT